MKGKTYTCAKCGAVMEEPGFTLKLQWRGQRKQDRLDFCKECGLPTLSELAVWRLTGQMPKDKHGQEAAKAEVGA